MYRPELVQAPIDHVKQILEKLSVHPFSKDMVAEALTGNGLSVDVGFVYKEWINEVLSAKPDSQTYKEAFEDPDGSFSSFGFKFAESPNDPSPRVISRLMEKYGFDFVSAIHKIHWAREIAWSDRLRNHQDDYICICAELFQKLLETRGASRVFTGLVEFAYENKFSLTLQDEAGETDLSIDDIRKVNLTDVVWLPLCIQYVRKERSKNLASIPTEKLASHANMIRKAYIDEHTTLEVTTTVKYLKEYPLTLRHMIAMQVLRKGLSSNEFSDMYDLFVEHVRSMRIIKPISELELEFSRFMEGSGSSSGLHVRSTNIDEKEIKQTIALINSSWLKTLPQPLLELNGQASHTFSLWREEVLDNKRTCPRNIVLDYYLFLLGREY